MLLKYHVKVKRKRNKLSSNCKKVACPDLGAIGISILAVLKCVDVGFLLAFEIWFACLHFVNLSFLSLWIDYFLFVSSIFQKPFCNAKFGLSSLNFILLSCLAFWKEAQCRSLLLFCLLCHLCHCTCTLRTK